MLKRKRNDLKTLASRTLAKRLAGETIVTQVRALEVDVMICKALVKEIVGSQATGRQEEENDTTSVCDKSDRASDSITCLFCRELHLNSTVLWGPFLERLGNFSGLKVNFKIKTC